MTAICNSQGMRFSFCDFMCANINYNKTPDVAGMDDAGALIFVGELKVPWVQAHSLKGFMSDENGFRIFLGQ